MTRSILMLCAALALVACDDKKADAPATEEPAATAEAETESAEEAPEAPAESAANDKPEGAVAKPAAMPDDLKPGEQGFFGAKFTVIEEPVTLASAMETPGKTVKISAEVKSVCKKKGCWFTMAGEGVKEEVRVRMKDYAFFVPKNSEAAKVVAEGVLSQREVPQDEAQHYADDAAEAGEEPKKVDGPQQVWEFTATAIELQAAEG